MNAASLVRSHITLLVAVQKKRPTPPRVSSVWMRVSLVLPGVSRDAK
jgi:hypothetical protein